MYWQNQPWNTIPDNCIVVIGSTFSLHGFLYREKNCFSGLKISRILNYGEAGLSQQFTEIFDSFLTHAVLEGKLFLSWNFNFTQVKSWCLETKHSILAHYKNTLIDKNQRIGKISLQIWNCFLEKKAIGDTAKCFFFLPTNTPTYIVTH